MLNRPPTHPGPGTLAADLFGWLQSEPRIVSAVLFGSSASETASPAGPAYADLDVHLIATDPAAIEAIDWAAAFPAQGFCLRALRPATGGTRKLTILFATGEFDLVLVPADRAAAVRRAMEEGRHLGDRTLTGALDEMRTCLWTGYQVLKDTGGWTAFYAQVDAEMTGVRLGDDEIRALADIFLADFIWIRKKLERGELVAAQHLLHRSLSETNLRLLRELRLRRGKPLPSFGLGRRVEQLLSAEVLTWVTVSARLDRGELAAAAMDSLEGFRSLLSELVPGWKIPAGVLELCAARLRG